MTPDEWNTHFPPGTHVDWVQADGSVLQAATSSVAAHTPGGLEVVQVGSELVLLARLRPWGPKETK